MLDENSHETQKNELSKKSKSLLIAVIIIIATVGIIAFHEFNKRQNQPDYASQFAVTNITTLIPSGGGRVAWSNQNVIAFSKFPNSSRFNGEIYTMNPDGSNIQNVTKGNSEVPHINNDIPEWSPDGKYIVFESVDPTLYNQLTLPTNEKQAIAEGGSGIDNNLWLITSNGSVAYELTHITEGEASLHPYFSPSGKELFWSARVLTSSGFQWELEVADLLFSFHDPYLANIRAYQPLGTSLFYESHGFELNENYVVFSSSANPTAVEAPDCSCALNLFVLNLTTGKTVDLTNDHNVWNEHASVSPDGKYILWVSSFGHNFIPSSYWGLTLKTDYWIMDINGSNKGEVTYFNTPGSNEYTGARVIVADSSWSPGGRSFVAPVLILTLSGSYSKIVVINLNQTA